MTLARANPPGWALFDLLLSSQMNAIDIQLPFALDGVGGGPYTPAATISLDGSVSDIVPLTLLGGATNPALDVVGGAGDFAIDIDAVTNPGGGGLHINSLGDESALLIDVSNLGGFLDAILIDNAGDGASIVIEHLGNSSALQIEVEDGMTPHAINVVLEATNAFGIEINGTTDIDMSLAATPGLQIIGHTNSHVTGSAGPGAVMLGGDGTGSLAAGAGLILQGGDSGGVPANAGFSLIVGGINDENPHIGFANLKQATPVVARQINWGSLSTVDLPSCVTDHGGGFLVEQTMAPFAKARGYCNGDGTLNFVASAGIDIAASNIETFGSLELHFLNAAAPTGVGTNYWCMVQTVRASVYGGDAEGTFFTGCQVQAVASTHVTLTFYTDDALGGGLTVKNDLNADDTAIGWNVLFFAH